MFFNGGNNFNVPPKWTTAGDTEMFLRLPYKALYSEHLRLSSTDKPYVDFQPYDFDIKHKDREYLTVLYNLAWNLNRHTMVF
jgi:hypothetical protein